MSGSSECMLDQLMCNGLITLRVEEAPTVKFKTTLGLHSECEWKAKKKKKSMSDMLQSLWNDNEEH